jgi:hypothetical protein
MKESKVIYINIGGLTEIFTGITGIFTNPYKQAKQEGVKGFFKGVGTGILGAIISPFSAVLRVGNSLATGIKNTANIFNRGKLKTNRFRHPRHIFRNQPLRSYDENFAEVQAIIKKIGGLPDNKVIFFQDFKYKEDDYDKEISTFIITDKTVLVVVNAKENAFSLDIKTIRNSEVHITHSSEDFLLLFHIKNSADKRYIMTDDIALCCQVHSILSKILNH